MKNSRTDHNRALTKIKIPIIQLLAEEPGLQKDHLSSDDWQILTNIRDILVSFYNLIKVTEGRHATLDKVLLSLDFMVVQFDLALELQNHTSISHYSTEDEYCLYSVTIYAFYVVNRSTSLFQPQMAWHVHV